MINVSAEDLASIVSKIDDAVMLHEKWRENFQRSLICKLAPSEADLSTNAHEQCAFGHWLYSKGNAHLLSLPAFGPIEMMHKAMHAKVRKLYEKRFAGHVIEVEDYDAYQEAATAFQADLLNLKERVAFTLHNIDPLTGAYCQSRLLPELRAEQQRQKQTGGAYSLLLIDLDLKEINNKLGRNAGDKVLQAAIASVRQALTAKDRIYRLVGAEFVICLPGKDARDAEQMKELLLARIGEAVSAATSKSEPTFQVNYSILELEPHAYLEELLDQAVRLTYTINL